MHPPIVVELDDEHTAWLLSQCLRVALHQMNANGDADVLTMVTSDGSIPWSVWTDFTDVSPTCTRFRLAFTDEDGTQCRSARTFRCSLPDDHLPPCRHEEPIPDGA